MIKQVFYHMKSLLYFFLIFQKCFAFLSPTAETNSSFPERLLTISVQDKRNVVERGEAALSTFRKSVAQIYGVKEELFVKDVKMYSSEKKLVDRMLRAIVLGDRFVIAVGGMSDTVSLSFLPLMCPGFHSPIIFLLRQQS